MRLIVVFQMLVMATQVISEEAQTFMVKVKLTMVQPPGGKAINKKVKDIQGDLAQLLYRSVNGFVYANVSFHICAGIWLQNAGLRCQLTLPTS